MGEYALVTLKKGALMTFLVGKSRQKVPWADDLEAVTGEGGIVIRSKTLGEVLLLPFEVQVFKGKAIVCFEAASFGENGLPVIFFGPTLRSRSEAMIKAFYLATLAARSGDPILITGESGTGKELLAQAIHLISKVPGPFVAVNMAAIPEDLAEAQLFGWVRGAFTGAVDSRPGAFEAAHGGTLFLDEIGDASPAIQAKILRSVETRQVCRLGSMKPVRIQTRLVAATHRELKDEVIKGAFRLDLYERLACFVIRIPPLRERLEDIPLLARDLLEGCDVELEQPVLDLLRAYIWPGNVRSLRNVLRRAAILNPGGRLTCWAIRDAIETSAPVPGTREPRTTTTEIIAQYGVPRSTYYYRLKRGRIPLSH